MSEENCIIREIQEGDGPAVVNIFNYFVRESFAGYPEKEFGGEFFEQLRRQALIFYVIETNHKVVGFGFVRPFNELENFSHTGVLTYFILPQYTRQGWGTKLLNVLIDVGMALGINNFVAHISSKNEQSLRFHKKLGFKECGRLKDMGVKFGQKFDIVWVQKQFIPSKRG